MNNNSHHSKIRYDFGTFEGGYWPTEFRPFDNPVPASEIMRWNELDLGDAEFWPTGDRPEMTLLFDEERRVCKEQLMLLSHLFDRMGGDTTENFLRIHHAVRRFDALLHELTAEMVAALVVHVAVAADARTARAQMEAELQGRYRFDAQGDALKFVTASTDWLIEELPLGETTAVVVAPLGKACSEPK